MVLLRRCGLSLPVKGHYSCEDGRHFTSCPPRRTGASRLDLALTTAPEIQHLMAEAGLVPVLDDIDVGRLKKQNPFWAENYDVIRDALRDARPRPKSKQWRKIEIELAKQIRWP
jgi:hypothetical protein